MCGRPKPTAGEPAEVAGRAVAALGIENGPSYTQLRITPDGPQVVEVAARLGGGHDAELCLAALGVNLNEFALRAALGEEIDPAALVPQPQAGGASTVFLTAEPGELEAIEGIEDAEAVRRRPARSRLPAAGVRGRRAPARRRPPRRRPGGGRLQGRGSGTGEGGRRSRTLPDCPCRNFSRRTTMLSFQPPAVGEEEVEAVARTIRSGWLTTGPNAAELERRFAAYVGAKHALAVSSGTAAMHLTLVALGIGPGDEVIHDADPILWILNTIFVVPFFFIRHRRNRIGVDRERRTILPV